MSAINPEPSLGELFGKLTSDVGILVRDEVQLAKVELTESATRAARAGGMMAGAGLAAFLAILMVSAAIAWGLAELVPIGVAFLIVALAWVAVGGVLFAVGRQRLQAANLKPEQTIESVQEDVRWAKQQMN